MKESRRYSSYQKPKGMGKIVGGVILLVIGVLIFQFLIPIITVTPTQYREEFGSAEVGTTWTIHGHLADKNSTEMAGETLYFYTFEEDRDAQISSSIDLGENGDEVIVKVEKTNAGLKFAETRSKMSPWLYKGAGGSLAVSGVILLIVGSVQFYRTKPKKKSSEESSVNEVDLSQLIVPTDSGIGAPPSPPFQPPQPLPPPGPPMQQFQPPSQIQFSQTRMPGQSMQPSQQQQAGQTPAPGQFPGLSQAPPPFQAPQFSQIQPSQQPAPSPLTQPTPTKPTIPQTPSQPGYQPPKPITQPAQQQHPTPKAQTAAQPTITPGTALSGFQPPLRPPATAPVRPAGAESSKGTWTCPNCGAEVDSKYIFCTSCGYKRGG